MSMLLTTLLSSLIPVGAEAVKQVVASKFGSVKPATIDDQIKLDDAEVRRMEAIAKLDNPGGTPSQWVIDLRASSRYVASWLCIIIGCSMMLVGVQTNQPSLFMAGAELVSVAFGFLFGTRLVANWKK